MKINDKPLHVVIDKAETYLGDKHALIWLWIFSKYPEGITSKQLSRTRGITQASASRILRNISHAGFMVRNDDVSPHRFKAVTELV